MPAQLPAELYWTAVRAQEDPPLGWYAKTFRGRTPSTTLVGSGRLAGGDRLVTELQFAAGADATADVAADAEPVSEKASKESIPA